MENKQAITNMKQGKNIPYKHETIATLITMADKLEKIERIVNRPIGFSEEEKAYNYMMQVIDIKEVLEQE